MQPTNMLCLINKNMEAFYNQDEMDGDREGGTVVKASIIIHGEIQRKGFVQENEDQWVSTILFHPFKPMILKTHAF